MNRSICESARLTEGQSQGRGGACTHHRQVLQAATATGCLESGVSGTQGETARVEAGGPASGGQQPQGLAQLLSFPRSGLGIPWGTPSLQRTEGICLCVVGGPQGRASFFWPGLGGCVCVCVAWGWLGFFLGTVCVCIRSCGCYNKSPQSWWLKATDKSSLMVSEARSLQSVSLG